MAKVSGPFLSIDARGTVAKSLTASGWKGIQYMRRWFKPQNPKTPAQVTVRDRFKAAVAAWHTEDAPTKELWQEYADRLGVPMSGFNWYVKRFVEVMRDSGTETPPTTPGFIPPLV